MQGLCVCRACGSAACGCPMASSAKLLTFWLMGKCKCDGCAYANGPLPRPVDGDVRQGQLGKTVYENAHDVPIIRVYIFKRRSRLISFFQEERMAITPDDCVLRSK